jgi:hypothetical protein
MKTVKSMCLVIAIAMHIQSKRRDQNVLINNAKDNMSFFIWRVYMWKIIYLYETKITLEAFILFYL